LVRFHSTFWMSVKQNQLIALARAIPIDGGTPIP
jgi:hypothetical protein